MGIEAKGSYGLVAECPTCHSAICHGFQVCQTCGHTVSAEEQKALQLLWLGNLAKFGAVAVTAFAVLFHLLT